MSDHQLGLIQVVGAVGYAKVSGLYMEDNEKHGTLMLNSKPKCVTGEKSLATITPPVNAFVGLPEAPNRSA